MTEATDSAAETGGGRRFHLIERIGAGAFGEVYLAEQDSGAGFRRKVALKVLHPRQKGSDDAAQRMRDEARLLGRLSHRNIVTVLDLVRLQDRWAIVMDFVAGADLEHVLEALVKVGDAFPAPAALEVASAVADAIEAAFNADDGRGGQLRVVHRDIKPANVRITNDGDTKVLDFGVASMQMESREAMTGQYLMGTERYMAPERILGEDEGPPGDIYATAATVVELMLGEPLGRTPVLPDRHNKFLDDKIAELEHKVDGPPEVVRDVCHLLRRALHDDPNERPTPAEFSDRCAALARKLPGEALRPFARRFVPNVDHILGHQADVVSGVLSEITSIHPLPGDTASAVSAASVAPVGDAETLSTTAQYLHAPEPEKSGRGKVLVASAAGVAVLAIGGVIVVAAVVAAVVAVVVLGGDEPGPADTDVAVVTDPEVPEAPREEPPAVPEDTDVAVADVEPPPVEPTAPVAKPPPVVRKPAPVVAPPVEVPKEEPPKVEEPVASGPPVSRAMVVMQDAQSLTVTCGPVSASGTASVRIADFPSGKCTVKATFMGKTGTTVAEITRPREVKCAPAGDGITCD